MVLSDRNITSRIEDGSLSILPYEPDNVEPASVDLRLGSDFKKAGGAAAFDAACLSDDSEDDTIDWRNKDDEIMLHEGDFALATTKERVEMPDDLAAEVLGRSSLGRLGISVHQTAGYIDPGFEGQITLELSNHGPASVKLCAGTRICQIVFSELSSPAVEPYGHTDSQYQDQSGATTSGMRFD